MKTKWKVFSVLPLFFLGACALTPKQACDEGWSKAHPEYTEDQKLALFYGAKGVGCIHEWYFKTGKDGKPEVAYERISLEKLLEGDRSQLADLRTALDQKDPEWSKIVKELELGPYFESEGNALQFRISRSQLKLNYEKFRDLMGTGEGSEDARKYRKGYNARIFMPEFDPEKDTPFNVKYVDNAKAEGRLVFIGKTILSDFELLGEKESDPEFPEDRNHFVWKKISQALEVNVYKVMDSVGRPRDKQAHYLEATRVYHDLDKDGNILSTRKESSPALRVFTSESGGLDVIVLDSDKEGKLGYGLPDVVEKLGMAIVNGKSLYLSHQPLLAQLFEEKPEEKRQPTLSQKKQKFEIALAGTPVDPWEKCPAVKGCSVSVDYKNDKGTNYFVEVKNKQSGHGGESIATEINHFKKVYHVPGHEHQKVRSEVVEYFKVKAPYNAKNVLSVNIDPVNRKKVSIEREGDFEVTAIVLGKNIFTEDVPFRVDFTGEDGIRFRLEDRENAGKFTHKTELSSTSDGDSHTPHTAVEFPYP